MKRFLPDLRTAAAKLERALVEDDAAHARDSRKTR
jgi:hypothetical protein